MTLCLISNSINGQTVPKIFIGTDIYRSTSYNNNSYYSLQLGVEIVSYKFIAPEISYEYQFGSLERTENYNYESHSVDDFLERKFNNHTFSISSKLYYGEDWRIIFIPKYSWSKVNIDGMYYDLNSDRNKYILVEQQTIEENVGYYSFGIGIEGNVFTNEKLILSLAIMYTNLDLEDLFNKLDFSEYGYGNGLSNTKTLGISVKLYLNPFKKDNY